MFSQNRWNPWSSTSGNIIAAVPPWHSCKSDMGKRIPFVITPKINDHEFYLEICLLGKKHCSGWQFCAKNFEKRFNRLVFRENKFNVRHVTSTFSCRRFARNFQNQPLIMVPVGCVNSKVFINNRGTGFLWSRVCDWSPRSVVAVGRHVLNVAQTCRLHSTLAHAFLHVFNLYFNKQQLSQCTAHEFPRQLLDVVSTAVKNPIS